MRKPPSVSRRKKSPSEGWRCHINFPGALAEAVKTRIEELESGTFSRFVVELVCFDLRIRRKHAITGPVADETVEIQAAIDEWIARNYQPGNKRNGDAIRKLMREARSNATPGRPHRSAHLIKECDWVVFPPLHTKVIEIRWRELGFAGVSEYVTSLIRYDLLLGGPHRYFRGDDCTSEMLAALDRETLEMFHASAHAPPEKTLEHRIMEEELGRPITREECEALMEIAVKQLKRHALAASV